MKVIGRKRRKAIKKRSKPKTNIEKLEKETIKNIRKVNTKLKSLQRKNKDIKFASKRLKNKLTEQQINIYDLKRNRIRIPKIKMNMTKLIYINKTLNIFLNSLTSTKKGIKEWEKRTKEGIQDLLEDLRDKEKVDNEDVEFYYETLTDSDFTDFSNKLKPSELWALIDYGVQKRMGKDEWINMLFDYMDIEPDEEIREKAERLYFKYVE